KTTIERDAGPRRAVGAQSEVSRRFLLSLSRRRAQIQSIDDVGQSRFALQPKDQRTGLNIAAELPASEAAGGFRKRESVAAAKTQAAIGKCVGEHAATALDADIAAGPIICGNRHFVSGRFEDSQGRPGALRRRRERHFAKSSLAEPVIYPELDHISCCAFALQERSEVIVESDVPAEIIDVVIFELD